MPDSDKGLRDLAAADRRIAEGEGRVSRQIVVIENQKRLGRDTAAAERLLARLRDTVDEWQEHRKQILLRISQQ
jgi:hypothetical protein